MYFVDRKILEERLEYFEKLDLFLKSKIEIPSALEEILAYERAVHMMIESLLDVGNQMIDGFIMRDPGSYEDIIEIMRDEKVIEDTEAPLLLKWVQLRKSLVVDYQKEKIHELFTTYQKVHSALDSFPGRIRAYLDEQLGPVSAFIPSS